MRERSRSISKSRTPQKDRQVSSEARAKLPRLSGVVVGPRLGAFKPSAIEAILSLLAIFTVGYVIFYYFSEVRPSRAKLDEGKRRYEEQMKILGASASNAGKGPSMAGRVNDARASLENFKSNQLQSLQSSRRSIFDEINGLARKHNLELTSGIQTESARKKSDEGKGSAQETVAG